MALAVARAVSTGFTAHALVPVALHPARRLERGYDQAALLAAEIGARTGLPVVPAVHRIRRGAPQATLDRSARGVSVRGAFVGEAAALRGQSVLLVDDVATTGATLAAAASAARASGARAVAACVVAVDE